MPFVCIIQVMMSLHNPPCLTEICKWNYSRLPSSFLSFKILGITTFQDIFQNPVDFSHKKGFCDMSSFWYTIFSGERKKSKVVFLLRSLIPKLCMELIRNWKSFMVLLYETKKDKGKGCIMKKIAKNPFLYLAMIFPKPAFDFTI